MSHDDAPRFEPDNVAGWQAWLEGNHATSSGMWLVYRKQGYDQNLSYAEAVDEALCLGWIDSLTKRIDEARYRQWFCPRKPDSMWSKVNKAKVAVLVEQGRMGSAGLASVALATANGSWTILDGPEALIVPEDLAAAMAGAPGTLERFRSHPPSTQRNALQWLVTAKRAATRESRIAAILQRLADDSPPF